MLLFRGIESVLFILQLRLEATQNLEIASQLPWHFSDVLSFELANSVFLVRKALPCGFQLAFKKLGGALRLLLTDFEVFVDE